MLQNNGCRPSIISLSLDLLYSLTHETFNVNPRVKPQLPETIPQLVNPETKPRRSKFTTSLIFYQKH